MFGRGKKHKEPVRRSHVQPQSDEAGFDMASYRRGTTLNSFKSNEPTQSERQRLKRLRALRRRMAVVLAAIVVLLVLGLSLLSQFTGSISTVVATDSNIVLSDDDIDRYRTIVDKYFADNSFERFGFARRNSVLLQYVMNEAPEVSAIKISPSGIASGKVEVTVRQPVAMWINGNQTDFVDSDGVVFDRNYYATPSIAIEDNSGVQLDGGVATSSSFLSFVGKTAVALSEQEGLQVERVVIPQGSARYVEFYLTGRNYPFKAQITRDATSQAHDIAVMTRYIDSHGISPQYVDCRVEGKAYWK